MAEISQPRSDLSPGEARLAQEKRGRAPALHMHRGVTCHPASALCSCHRRFAIGRSRRLLLGVGGFLCGCGLGRDSPRRDDAIHAGVGDGLAEMLVEVGDDQIDDIAVVRLRP